VDHGTGAGPAQSDHLRLVQEVVGLWVQMQSRLQAHFTALAGEHSLSAIQAKVLLQLDPDQPVTMRALAARLQYDPSNLTGVIDRLEALGAVRRQPDPNDRRVRGLILTAAGARMRDPFWQQLINDAGPLGQLDAGDLEQLRAILRSAIAEPEPGGPDGPDGPDGSDGSPDRRAARQPRITQGTGYGSQAG
jgi:DNA-binding MarR family transcriptional regulator